MVTSKKLSELTSGTPTGTDEFYYRDVSEAAPTAQSKKALISSFPVGPTGAVGPTGPAGSFPVSDATEIIKGSTATGKRMKFEVDGFAATGVRTITVADQDIDMTPGQDYQAQDAVLDDLAALSPVADNEFVVGSGAGVYAHEGPTTARSSMGLGALAILGEVGTAEIADNAVTYAKIQNAATSARIIGRNTAGPGDLEELTEAAFKIMFNLEAGIDYQTFDATLTDLAALDIVAINELIVGTGAGAYTHQKISVIAQELTPVTGDWVLGEEVGTGTIRRMALGDLPSATGPAGPTGAAGATGAIGPTGPTGSGAALPVVDTTEIVKGSAATGKRMRIEVDGFAATGVRVLTMADQNIDLTPGSGSFASEAEGNLANTALQDITGELLEDLGNVVSAADPTTGNLLAWNGASWTDFTKAALGMQTLDDVLTDLSSLGVVATGELIFGTGGGVYSHQKISDQTLEVAPTGLDVLLGEEVGTGLVRKFQVSSLIGQTGPTGATGPTGPTGSAGGFPVSDATVIIKGSAATGKQLRFEVDGFAATGVKVITAADQNIDMTPGADYQAQDAVLDDLAALSTVAGNNFFIVGTAAGVYAHENAETARLSMGAQLSDLVLNDLSALDEVLTNELLVGTGTGVYTHQKISAIAQEATPVTGDLLLGEEVGTGTIRRFAIGDLPSSAGPTGPAGPTGGTGPTGADGVDGSSLAAVETVTGTAYSLVLADRNKLKNTTNASAVAISIPLNASQAFTVGDSVHVLQDAAGQVTIQGVTGVTVQSTVVTNPTTPRLRKENAIAALVKLATDTWIVGGELIVT